jgi:uncharacterized SAM-binding protein YcdF (DUF218 family)
VPLAIVVPGHGAVAADGVYRITGRCRRLVAEAERVAETEEAAAVVFSGWSPRGGRSEAEQMADAWRGPAIDLVVEAAARTTVENAVRTLPLLLERDIDRAVIVCAAAHLLRTRLFFGRLYGAHGIATRFRVLRALPPPASIAWELVALPLCPWQLRAARAELARRTP